MFSQAAELLNHPHLQPYILKVHIKLNSPRRSTFPFQWADSNYARRTRFVEPASFSTLSVSDRGKRLSFSNDRALNPSISGTEQGSLCSTQRAQGFSACSKDKHYEQSVGCVSEECNMPRMRTAKESATPRRHTIPSKIPRISSKYDSVSLSTLTTQQLHLYSFDNIVLITEFSNYISPIFPNSSLVTLIRRFSYPY